MNFKLQSLMKNVLKSLALVAVSALAVVSCQKNELAGGNDGEGVFFSLRTADAGKTYIVQDDNKYLPQWAKDDEIGVFFDEFAKEKTTPAGKLTNSNESGNVAKFEGKISSAPESGTIYAFYPSSALGKTYDGQSIGFDMPSVQHPTATSFDPAADILVAKPLTFTAEGGTVKVNVAFARILATLKVNLNSDFVDVKNQKVSNFKLEATEATLSGRAAVSMKDANGKITVWNTKNKSVSAAYGETSTVAVAGTDNSVFVTINPETIAAGETITFTIETEGYIITKEITLTNDIVLTPGNLTEINLGIAEEHCKAKQNVDYSGSYLIVSENHLLTDYNADKYYYNHTDAEGTELADFWEIAGIENYVWTVAKLADGSYSFYNSNTEKYLALNNISSNSAHEAEETNEYTAITIAESNALLTINSKKFEGRNLRYNTSFPRFAFYSGTTTGTAATLLKYTSDPRPKFDAVSGLSWDASSKTLSWTAVEGATNGYEYTTDNGTSIVAVESNSVDCSSWTNGDYSVKVRVVGTDAKKTSEWSSACEFTISGGAAAKYYRKVIEDLGDWTGTYLIVSGSSAANGTITSSWLGYITVNADTDNKILSDTNTDAVAVTIEETEAGGNYTIQFANGKYLGTTDSNNGIKVADSAGNGFKWKFSFNEGLVKIENTIKEDRHLRLNGTSGFRTYTGTTGTQATLYKLDEAALSSITVSGTPTKTAYSVGEAFDTDGLVVTATYADASQKDITNSVDWTVTPETLSAGTTSVKVVATYKGVTSNEYVVNGLSVKALNSISVKTAPTKVVYTEGEKFDPAGLVIYRNYSDSSKDEYAYAGNESDFEFNPTTSTSLTTSVTSVTITYSGKSVNQAITVNEVQPLSTMDEIFAAATAAGSTATDAKVKFNNWVVSGVNTNKNNIYVTDGTKGFIIFDSNKQSAGFAVGDILSGTVNCKVQLYNDAAELKSLTSTTEGLTVTKGGTITPATIAIANLSGVNTGAVITFESLQYNGSAFSDGANTIKPYNTFISLPTLINGRSYSVTGVYIQYGSTKEIAPRTNDDIVEKAAPKYAVNVDGGITNGTVTVDFSEATEGQTVTITATPATGYKVKSVTAKKTASGDAITVTNNKFTMPAEAVTVSAEFEEAGSDEPLNLTFDLSSNPGGWPTTNSTTLTNYTYTLDNTAYTFALKNVKCNSGYLMLTQPAALGLPAIEGKKLTKVVAKNTSGCSTSVNVGISSSSSAANYISGGSAQKWATQSSSYTYTLSETSGNTMYYLYVTTKNAQITELTLTYE